MIGSLKAKKSMVIKIEDILLVFNIVGRCREDGVVNGFFAYRQSD